MIDESDRNVVMHKDCIYSMQRPMNVSKIHKDFISVERNEIHAFQYIRFIHFIIFVKMMKCQMVRYFDHEQTTNMYKISIGMNTTLM